MRLVFTIFDEMFYLIPITTDIDKDLREVDTLLTPLDEPELECLFRDLGLSDARVRNKRSSDRNVYATSLIRYWIIENDDVGKKGGATWKTLKECLNRLGHRGIAEKIENGIDLCVYIFNCFYYNSLPFHSSRNKR